MWPEAASARESRESPWKSVEAYTDDGPTSFIQTFRAGKFAEVDTPNGSRGLLNPDANIP